MQGSVQLGVKSSVIYANNQIIEIRKIETYGHVQTYSIASVRTFGHYSGPSLKITDLFYPWTTGREVCPKGRESYTLKENGLGLGGSGYTELQ